MKEDNVLEAKKRYETSLLALPSVVGVGTGELEYEGKRRPCIRLYVQQADEELEKRVPKILDGFPVTIEVVGKAILY